MIGHCRWFVYNIGKVESGRERERERERGKERERETQFSNLIITDCLMCRKPMKNPKHTQ